MSVGGILEQAAKIKESVRLKRVCNFFFTTKRMSLGNYPTARLNALVKLNNEQLNS